MEVSGQLHALAALHPSKVTPVSIGYEAELASELVWRLRRGEKCFATFGIRTAAVQAVAHLYTDCAVPAHLSLLSKEQV
jgi:hypothetical protein